MRRIAAFVFLTLLGAATDAGELAGNLLLNGGFEKPNAQTPALPALWQVEAIKQRQWACDAVVQLDKKVFLEGTCSLGVATVVRSKEAVPGQWAFVNIHSAPVRIDIKKDHVCKFAVRHPGKPEDVMVQVWTTILSEDNEAQASGLAGQGTDDAKDGWKTGAFTLPADFVQRIARTSPKVPAKIQIRLEIRTKVHFRGPIWFDDIQFGEAKP